MKYQLNENDMVMDACGVHYAVLEEADGVVWVIDKNGNEKELAYDDIVRIDFNQPFKGNYELEL